MFFDCVNFYELFFFHVTLPFILQFCPFNENVQREITGHTTQYYQNTTKGFEFTYANFKIKAVKIAKGDK